MKLRLASLAHVHGEGVAVHNHGRFVRVTVDVKHRQRLPQGSPHCVPASSIHTPV